MSKVFLTLLLGVALAGCHRSVKVNTAPAPQTKAATFRVTNNLTQPVNVHVMSNGTDILAGTVGANTTMALSVPGVADGSTVSLTAHTVDGKNTYTRDDVTLSSTYTWQVP